MPTSPRSHSPLRRAPGRALLLRRSRGPASLPGGTRSLRRCPCNCRETVTSPPRWGPPPVTQPRVGPLPLPGPGGSCPRVLLQLLVDKARRGLPGSQLGLQGPRRCPAPPGWGGPALPPSGSGPWAPWLDARRPLPEQRAFRQGTWEQAFLVGGGAGRGVPGFWVPAAPPCGEGSGGSLGRCTV